MGHSSLVLTVLAGGLVAAAFASCAQGSDLPSGTGGAGSAGSSTQTGPSGGMVGSTCKSQSDCTQGTCTPIGGKSYCTVPCPPACPGATYCTIIGGTPVCAPDLGQECAVCALDSDCKLPSDVCLVAPLGDAFCARDCTVDGICPEGFDCMGKAEYAAGDAGAPDAGAPDAGAGGAGTGGAATSTSTSTGAGTGGAGPSPTMPSRWCVPSGGLSCPCDDKRDGVVNACSVSNSIGTCTGTQTCNGKQQQWQGCTAQTPAPETCNGKDDDCDGMIDEGDASMLCGGSPPPHGAWACTSGACALGSCDAGWAAYPSGGTPAQGCACPVDVGEPNDTCAMATPAGTVTDVGTPISFEGTLSSDTDVDVWSITTVDTDEMTTNSYHVKITFSQPATNTEFLMDVTRGDPCTDAPSGPTANITAYDWCVNGTASATVGEASCGPEAAVHCGGVPGPDSPPPPAGDHSATYYVRVHRAPGVAGTCTPYQITATAAGGECDFSQMCGTP
jgi:hypothetical protein